MIATHPKFEWSRADIDVARGDALDFDNIFQVIPINPHAGYIQGRFLVFRRTSGKSEQSPTWYPGRDLKKELRANFRKARKRAKIILADLKKLREARESYQAKAGVESSRPEIRTCVDCGENAPDDGTRCAECREDAFHD